MYDKYKNKKQIIIWLKVSKCKRAHESVEEEQSSKRPKNTQMGKSNHDVYLQKMTEVELIVEELESIHVAGHYTPEQIRACN